MPSIIPRGDGVSRARQNAHFVVQLSWYIEKKPGARTLSPAPGGWTTSKTHLAALIENAAWFVDASALAAACAGNCQCAPSDDNAWS